MLYPANLPFKNEGKIKAFPDNKNRKHVASRLALKEILKELFKMKASDLRHNSNPYSKIKSTGKIIM